MHPNALKDRGKTLALGAMMCNTGRLCAFDVSGHRLDALKPRLARSSLSPPELPLRARLIEGDEETWVRPGVSA